MSAQRGAHCVGKMAKVLGVSRGGFYRWAAGCPSKRSQQDAQLVEDIREIQKGFGASYGSPRVTEQLRRDGKTIGHNRVARLMREHGLAARPKRRFRVTTKAAKREAAPNLVGREFWPASPNRVWASDITYLATAEGWLYLAVVLDLHSRRVVGWSMGTRLTKELVLRAFWMAVLNRGTPPGLIFHSDRGSQYTSGAFCAALRVRGCRQSMSRRANVWDNAPCEAFFKTLKTEAMSGRAFATRAEARRVVFEYVEVFYNRVRLHSSLGYGSPQEYEQTNRRVA